MIGRPRRFAGPRDPMPAWHHRTLAQVQRTRILCQRAADGPLVAIDREELAMLLAKARAAGSEDAA